MSTTKTVSIEALRPNPWNTNFTSPANEAKLDASIARFGMFKPIVVREVPGETGFEIIGGEHRWESARRLKIAEVPVFNVGVIDDQRAKEITLADNSRYGADDSVALSELLTELGTDDLKEFLPYSDADLASIFQSNIALDELDLLDPVEDTTEIEEIKTPRAPKTHTMVRFKLANEDA